MGVVTHPALRQKPAVFHLGGNSLKNQEDRLSTASAWELLFLG